MKIKCEDFDLAATLESGQVFGFEKDGQGRFKGVLGGRSVRLWQSNGALSIERTTSQGDTLDACHPSPNVSPGTWSGSVRDYFDLDRDLTSVFDVLRQETALAPALAAFRGLRLIRQDPWEALACFILSSNNNVKRIMGMRANLVRHFGAFPLPAQVAGSHERTLRQLGLGYRAPFLQRTAQFLSVNPAYLGTVRSAGYEEARSRVTAFPGIGPKVADCVLLYGFNRLDAFPVDVWILRAMRTHYFRGRRVSEPRVHAFGRERWGALAGYVQQYLFHGARTGVIKS